MNPPLQFPLIDVQSPESVQRPLLRLGLVNSDDRICELMVAGEGNMNCVLRVIVESPSTTVRKTFIVKQSRPWVAKYPSIPAPVERISAETEFLKQTAGHPKLSQTVPRILGTLEDEHLLVLEDLGDVHDQTSCYETLGWKSLPINQLTDWLATLHSIDPPEKDPGIPSLRKLNAAHIFRIPFTQPPSIDLNVICPGLLEATADIRANETVKAFSEFLRTRYLSPAFTSKCSLLHGDFYPGSWLSTERGHFVIDAEFCYVGEAEFDVAVLAAHVILAGGPASEIAAICDRYVHSSGQKLNDSLVGGWAGMEIIRRILGVAQLPLNETLEHRVRCLKIAEELLENGHSCMT